MLSLSLLYDPEDPTDMVHRLLSLGFGSQADLVLILDGNCDCLDGAEKISGGVWRYELHTTQVLATDKASPVLSGEAVSRMDVSVQKLIDLADETRRSHTLVGQKVATKDDIDQAIHSIELTQGKDVLSLHKSLSFVTSYAQRAHERLNRVVLYSAGALIASVAAVVAVLWRT